MLTNVITVKELADRWGRSPKTIYNELGRPQPNLPEHFRFRGRIYFPMKAVEDYEREHLIYVSARK